MSGPRQNTQRKLARAPGERGEAPIAGDPGAEPVMAAPEPESPAAMTHILRVEAQLDRTAEVRDPYARWCGRGGAARRPPIPISDPQRTQQQCELCLSKPTLLITHDLTVGSQSGLA